MTTQPQPRSTAPGDVPYFLRWTLYRPVTVAVAFFACLVVGVLVYPRIGVQLMPSGLSTGQISVWIQVPDSTPQEVMEQIVKPAEDRLRTIPGIQGVFSTSRSSGAHLNVSYDPYRDGDQVAADVRERLDRAKLTWPDGVDRYNIWRGRMDSDMPIYIAALGLDTSDEDVDLNAIYESVIQSRLLAIDGVARVQFWGLLDRRVAIELDNELVSAYHVPVRELIQRLSQDNRNITGGKIAQGDREYLIRSVGRFGDFEEIREYPIDQRLRVGDVGTVDFDYGLQSYYSRVNGQLAKVVVVYKDSMANTIEVCKRVDETLEQLDSVVPRQVAGVDAVERFTFLNQGDIINLSIGSLKESGAWGGVFAMLILYVFFRRLKVTALVTLAIPFSLLITIIWIYFRDGSFNILSLMGMSLGIGMLVDNSIVVVENIVRKHEAGRRPMQAATEGVRDIGLAVSMATLTTVVVFGPIMFMGDPRFKTMFQAVGLPLCISVLASLVVALVFVPQGLLLLQHRGRGVTAPLPRSRRRVERVLRVGGGLLNRWTRRVLGWCLSHRFGALVIFVGILFSTSFLLQRIPVNFDMREGHSQVELRVDLPKNLSAYEANQVIDRIERTFYVPEADGTDPSTPQKLPQERHGIRAVTSWFDSRGGGMSLFFKSGTRIEEEKFFASVRGELPEIPGVSVQLRSDMFDTSDTRKRVRVFARGKDLSQLEELGDAIQALLRDRSRFPELYDVRPMRDDERDEVRVSVDREVAQRYGIDSGSVASMVSWAIRGAVLPDFVTADRELSLWIRFADAEKERLDELDMIPVYGEDGNPVRLENLASYGVHPGPGSIRRINGKMTAAVVAESEVTDDAAFNLLKNRVREALRGIPTPEGFDVSLNPRFDGGSQDFSSMLYAGVLAICLVFLVMGVLFESFSLPFCVLLSIPHAFFGSIWALYLTGTPLDPIGLIGLIMLVGIVVNNAIVLVDTINRKRVAGRSRRGAILEASRVRFRPIWMTAATTIFGLLPLIILPQRGEGMDYKAMATVIVGGLMTSTFFTLFVVPLFYTLLDDLRRFVATLVVQPRRLLARHGAEPAMNAPGESPR